MVRFVNGYRDLGRLVGTTGSVVPARALAGGTRSHGALGSAPVGAGTTGRPYLKRRILSCTLRLLELAFWLAFSASLVRNELHMRHKAINADRKRSAATLKRRLRQRRAGI